VYCTHSPVPFVRTTCETEKKKRENFRILKEKSWEYKTVVKTTRKFCFSPPPQGDRKEERTVEHLEISNRR
jgi:hypothetical protein